MASPEVLDIVNELLEREQGCVALRLNEAGTFVNRLSLRQGTLLRHMAQESREHVGQLASLVADLGGTPAPRVADIHATEMHYWGVNFALAHVVEDQEALIAIYAAAGARLGGEPRAQRIVGKILARHQARLAAIKALLPPDVQAVS